MATTEFSLTSGLNTIQIKVIAKDTELLPTYGSLEAAGADLRAFLTHDLVIPAGGSALVPTGLIVEIPPGYEMQIRPRSGLALKNQVTVLNSPGTIDSDYRGEIGVILVNFSNQNFVVTPYMRIAQCVIAPFIRAEFMNTTTLTSTERGAGGFGSSGTH